ncbi:MAG: glutamine amidotransferase [Planctomycetia bacterium]|nr:glutamine amidotransferase [Planctomycetia bacterium]
MKTNKICYLGDGDICGPAAYLAGIMTHFGVEYDRVDSDASPAADFLEKEYAAYVLSDYPAQNFSQEQLAHLAQAVRNGSGLAMFGGWESYHGRLGEYHETILADVLPVVMEQTDDRRNFAQQLFVVPARGAEKHPIIDALPWGTPPGIGGFNLFSPKAGAETILEAIQFHVKQTDGAFSFQEGMRFPLLVGGDYGSGRVLALATDVAPHWVGGFVDWGTTRVVQEIPGADFIDVGADYATFFRNVLLYIVEPKRD